MTQTFHFYRNGDYKATQSLCVIEIIDFFGKYFELMSVYYFVRASVVINYVNKNINNCQTRSEQNMQNI